MEECKYEEFNYPVALIYHNTENVHLRGAVFLKFAHCKDISHVYTQKYAKKT